MAKNNPASDRYNPPRMGSNDYEETKFSEVTVGELIWFSTERSDSNHSFRKINEAQVLDTHTRETKTLNPHTKIYYRI